LVVTAGPQFRPSSSRRLAARDLDIAGGDFLQEISSAHCREHRALVDAEVEAPQERIVLIMTTMTSPRTTALTRTLLGAGVVAGPLFVGTVILQLFTRVGFDLRRQPLSMLSLGEYGWIQMTNFIVSGVLSVLFAIGVARCLSDGPGSTWAPRLLALFGAGLVIGGIFTADPALGFPPGAPAGYPEQLSFHAAVHAFAPPLAFLSVIAACLIIARRFAAEGMRRTAMLARVVAVACFVLGIPVGPGFSVRLFLAVALAFASIAAYALYLRRVARQV
jgi:hypothetical membrane protein